MAAAIGQTINIPVIVRSLSRDFYRSAVSTNYSIPLDREFLLALDAGITTASGQSIDEFEHAWWKNLHTDATVLPSKFLNIYTVEECLQFH